MTETALSSWSNLECTEQHDYTHSTTSTETPILCCKIEDDIEFLDREVSLSNLFTSKFPSPLPSTHQVLSKVEQPVEREQIQHPQNPNRGKTAASIALLAASQKNGSLCRAKRNGESLRTITYAYSSDDEVDKNEDATKSGCCSEQSLQLTTNFLILGETENSTRKQEHTADYLADFHYDDNMTMNDLKSCTKTIMNKQTIAKTTTEGRITGSCCKDEDSDDNGFADFLVDNDDENSSLLLEDCTMENYVDDISLISSSSPTPLEVEDYFTVVGDKGQDRLSSLPEDVLFRITSFLDASSLLLSLACVNRKYWKLSDRNEAGWAHRCQSLWRTKCHVATEAISEFFEHNNKCQAYKIAWKDAQQRQHVTESDLCFDHTTGYGTVWSFRFKQAAGSDWTSFDPWFLGLPCRKMVFLKNGQVKEAIQQTVPLSHHYISHSGIDFSNDRSSESLITSSTLTLTSSFRHQHSRPNQNLNINNSDGTQSINHNQHIEGGPINVQKLHETSPDYDRLIDSACNWRIVDPPLPMTWRFLSRPMDLPIRMESGSYVRITVGGRDVPTYSVSRSKSGNWGFVMESCWGLWASFELPPRNLKSTSSSRPIYDERRIRNNSQIRNDGHRNVRVRSGPVLRRRPHRTGGAVWVQEIVETDDEDEVETSYEHSGSECTAINSFCTTSGSDDDDDDSSTKDNVHHHQSKSNSNNSSKIPHNYLQDDTLQLTNEIQWREAFLYNVGARNLPDGTETTDDFDRLWGGIHR